MNVTAFVRMDYTLFFAVARLITPPESKVTALVMWRVSKNRDVKQKLNIIIILSMESNLRMLQFFGTRIRDMFLHL